MLDSNHVFPSIRLPMKIVADIARRFSVRLMPVAILALALQASGASAYGLGDRGDCASGIHLSPSTHPGGDAPPLEQAAIGQVHGAPWTSACRNVAYSMAVLALPATLQTPASTQGLRSTFVSEGGEGIDGDGLSRPPRTSP